MPGGAAEGGLQGVGELHAELGWKIGHGKRVGRDGRIVLGEVLPGRRSGIGRLLSPVRAVIAGEGVKVGVLERELLDAGLAVLPGLGLALAQHRLTAQLALGARVRAGRIITASLLAAGEDARVLEEEGLSLERLLLVKRLAH